MLSKTRQRMGIAEVQCGSAERRCIADAMASSVIGGGGGDSGGGGDGSCGDGSGGGGGVCERDVDGVAFVRGGCGGRVHCRY